ncbi:MAG TPA: NrfD/PsrC family molybdoenzyme membrane anchor subunit [Thermoanaerobaculia bacterium]|nr:NrfD/PsrC family molybdoenzyme membrane anchor subunit [Thermoanaerobaculia bacterium]
MAMLEASADRYDRPPVVGSPHDAATVTDQVSNIVYGRTPLWWLGTFAVAFSIFGVMTISIFWLLIKGTGIWGINVPVGWGFAIINFVWWIGIGHAGTLISAILLLLRQEWRTSINRFAEAMTLFAVACAGLFPLLHTGRPWLGYWLLPIPNTMGMWPNFRSPLIWDVFAVTTYATVSALFWFTGLIPDLATFRDHAKNKLARTIYGIASMGWRGSARHWHNYESVYLLLAGLSTPLVLSVHTVVSFDFAMSIVPGWHTTIFPPYFVAGAVYAGFAMVLTLVIPLRPLFKIQDLITERHLQNMAKVMLVTGLIVAYGYAMELFVGWYSGHHAEKFMLENRITGPYWPIWWSLILFNVAIPQLLWAKRNRTSPMALFAISMSINVGMWLERFVIVATSLHRDYLVSSWDMYTPTKWDWGLYLGTIGFFLTLMLLFIRYLPMIAIFEMRTLTPGAKVKHPETHAKAH